MRYSIKQEGDQADEDVPAVTAGAITRVPLARTGLTKPFRPNAGAPDSARPRDNRL